MVDANRQKALRIYFVLAAHLSVKRIYNIESVVALHRIKPLRYSSYDFDH